MDRLEMMRTFIAAADAGSFSAAADRVRLTNKGVSKYVAALEEALGVRLFNRSTRKLSLTEAGHRYLEGAREAVEAVDMLEASLTADQHAIRGRLKIAVSNTFGELHMGDIVRVFCALHPEVTIDLHHSDRYVDLVEEGFDLAVRIGELSDSSMIAKKAGTTEMWAVASPAFIEKHGPFDTPSDLQNAPAIRDANLRAGAFWPFGVNGGMKRIAINPQITVNSARTAVRLAIDGVGIAHEPTFVVAPIVADGRLVRLVPAYPSLSLDINVVFPDNRHLPTKTRKMIDHIAAEIAARGDWSDASCGRV